MARLFVGALLVAASAVAAVAAPASAQTQNPILTPHYRVLSPLTYQQEQVEVGRGRLAFQNNAQHAVASRALTNQIIPVVNAGLANPQTAEYSNLRTGRLNKTAFYCGTVNSQSANGETESRRFIARAGAAVLETAENHDAFQAGWRSTGCGF